jgi:hypothetical protein
LRLDQAEEYSGLCTDPNGDGFVNELTVADLTAASIYQAALLTSGLFVTHKMRVDGY